VFDLKTIIRWKQSSYSTAQPPTHENDTMQNSNMRNKLLIAFLIVLFVPLLCAELLSSMSTTTSGFATAIPVTVGLGLAVGITLFLSRGWNQQLNEIKSTLNNTLDGNRSARASISSHDELGGLAESLNRWLDRTSNRLEKTALPFDPPVRKIDSTSDHLSTDNHLPSNQIMESSATIDEILNSIHSCLTEDESRTRSLESQGDRKVSHS